MFQRGKKGTWYTNFRFKGKLIRESLGTADRARAEEREAKLKLKLYDQVDGKCTETWGEACLAYLADRADNADLDVTKAQMQWLLTQIDEGLVIDKVDARLIGEVRMACLTTVITNGKNIGDTRSQATTNRYMGTIKKVLRFALERGQVRFVPVIKMKKEKLKHKQFMSEDEALVLMATLTTDKQRHLLDAIRFTLVTGLRESNVLNLVWSQINWEAKTLTTTQKGDRELTVALNTDAMDVLAERKAVHAKRGIITNHVFTYQGKPVTRFNCTAFRKARVAAGLEWLRWHDLRHTWASWAAQRGVGMLHLKEMGGWASLKMVERYAHLSPSTLAECAERVRLPVAKTAKLEAVK